MIPYIFPKHIRLYLKLDEQLRSLLTVEFYSVRLICTPSHMPHSLQKWTVDGATDLFV